jgi:hypothetical protein
MKLVLICFETDSERVTFETFQYSDMLHYICFKAGVEGVSFS